LECLEEWAIENIAWEILVLTFVFLIFKFFPGTFQAVKISLEILKDNRNTRGNAWGKYSADRFIDVWYSSLNTPLRYECGVFYYNKFDSLNSRHWMDFIDGELIKYGLIEIFDAPKGYKAVRPIKNWRNGLIASMVKLYLIKFIGDNQKYYKDLEEQSKK